MECPKLHLLNLNKIAPRKVSPKDVPKELNQEIIIWKQIDLHISNLSLGDGSTGFGLNSEFYSKMQFHAILPVETVHAMWTVNPICKMSTAASITPRNVKKSIVMHSINSSEELALRRRFK